MKKIIIPAMLGFGVALAFIIGQKMSTDAMAVVIGVAVGVAASVPTSLLLVALVRRQSSSSTSLFSYAPPRQLPAPPQQQPNFVILPPHYTAAPYIPSLPQQQAGLRDLRVIGDDGADWQ